MNQKLTNIKRELREESNMQFPSLNTLKDYARKLLELTKEENIDQNQQISFRHDLNIFIEDLSELEHDESKKLARYRDKWRERRSDLIRHIDRLESQIN